MKTIINRTSTEEEHAGVLAYVRKKYAERLGTVPGGSEIYFSAIRENVVVGAIALDFCDASEQLPMERIYKIDKSNLDFSIDSLKGAQFGRWAAEDSTASLSLLYYASAYALHVGKEHGWLYHKDPVHRFLVGKKIEFYPMPDAVLIEKNIPAEDLKFYITPPFPQCYIMPLSRTVQALQPTIDLFLREEKISFQDFC